MDREHLCGLGRGIFGLDFFARSDLNLAYSSGDWCSPSKEELGRIRSNLPLAQKRNQQKGKTVWENTWKKPLEGRPFAALAALAMGQSARSFGQVVVSLALVSYDGLRMRKIRIWDPILNNPVRVTLSETTRRDCSKLSWFTWNLKEGRCSWWISVGHHSRHFVFL